MGLRISCACFSRKVERILVIWVREKSCREDGLGFAVSMATASVRNCLFKFKTV